MSLVRRCIIQTKRCTLHSTESVQINSATVSNVPLDNSSTCTHVVRYVVGNFGLTDNSHCCCSFLILHIVIQINMDDNFCIDIHKSPQNYTFIGHIFN